MSRKYCEVCGERHNNGGQGLCDTHIEQVEALEIKRQNEEARQWDAFLYLSEEERWREVFDFMRAQGWEMP